MPSAAEHALLLKKLLPEGPIWSTSDQTDGTDNFSKLLLALGADPARLDEAAAQLITLTIPDTVDCDMDSWERVLGLPDECNLEAVLSDEQRLAAIVGKLRGRGAVTRAHIEEVLQGLRFDISDVQVLDRATPGFRVGNEAVGQPVRGDQWFATYLVEYMDNDLGNAPDDFVTGWTASNIAITPAQFGSPVTQDQTASEAVVTGAGTLTKDVAGENGETVRASVWVRTVSGDLTLSIGTVNRDGAIALTTFDVGPSWARLEVRQSVGTGGSAPKFRIASNGPASFYFSWAVCGIVDPVFECQAEHQAPINTTAEFNVNGENGDV